MEKNNEEDILKNIIAKLPGHIYWKDKRCIYLGCNDAQANSLGLKSRHEILGKSDFDLPWKEQAPKLREVDLKVINSGESITVEEPALLTDGTLAIFLSKKEPLKDNHGNIIGVLGVSIDITEKRKVEIELQETQRKLENVINSIPGHIYWKDINGVYLGCNDLQAKDAGFSSKEEMLEKTDFDMPWREQAELLRRIDTEVIQMGVAQTVEEFSTLADGSEAIFLSKKVPLYYEGKTVGILGVSLDITEKRRIENELLETQHKLDGMTLVSAAIAHELGTPLAAFGMAADNIKHAFPHLKQAYLWAKEKGAPIDEDNIVDLTYLETALDSMRKEIEFAFTFIDIALKKADRSIDRGKPEALSVSDIVDGALLRYPFKTDQRALLLWERNSHIDFLINCDKVLITHVFFNLLKNALYYVASW